ncbi:hypothetical protein [Halapricum desulfuricans]|uniref:Uncharacterized protein n=1 Tax=Halapricum desulfuricans TaxID=2841257 RepID=A0A897MVW0_9EURY|nr:hypothetical protein [Halapricum desulfuricans]QSG04644.1 hypothetical protein HSR121_0288 [Halapricum desulfuricans]
MNGSEPTETDNPCHREWFVDHVRERRLNHQPRGRQPRRSPSQRGHEEMRRKEHVRQY